MKLLYQKQIWNEYGYSEFIDTLRNQFECVECEVIPFTEELVAPIDFIPDLVLGSGRLVDIARNNNWPTYRSFDPSETEDIKKKHFLNCGGGYFKLTEVDMMREVIGSRFVFVKPCIEKMFTGCVIDLDKPIEDQVQFSTSDVDDPMEELVLAAPIREIKQEYRIFVVRGEIITGSLYKDNGVARYELLDGVFKGSDVYEFIRHISTIKKGKNLLRNFTGSFDVARVDDGYMKIIEFNNLNSAGVYASDYQKLTEALHDDILLGLGANLDSTMFP